MPSVKVSNNAYGTLLSSISSASTSLTLQSGEGSRFPSVTTASGDYFFISLINTSNQIEIAKVTNRVADTLTITRGQDGTTARTYIANDRVELRPVAALLNALPNRELLTADYQDSSVTAAKLATTGVVAGNYGGVGVNTSFTVNSKGQLTSATNNFGYTQKIQYDFTTRNGSQTWTKPSNAGKLVRVQVWGAGGSGAANASNSSGGGGGGGGYIEGWFSVNDLSATAAIVVGEGGALRNTDAAGEDGQNTTFNSGSISLTAYGGGGGGNITPGGPGGGGGGELSGGLNGGTTVTSGALGGDIGGGRGGGGSNVGSTATENNNGQTATTIYGGGGGGGCNGQNANTFCVGGKAVYGGGGGGSGYNGTATGSGAIGGKSLYGGDGGYGATNPNNAGDGVTPGGGGGGSELTGRSGAGGNGRVIITVW
jgi:hypothetical protein